MTRYFTFLLLFSIVCLTARADVWTQLTDFPGAPRSSSVAFSIGDAAYIGTGYDSTSFKRSFYKYDRDLNFWFEASSLGGDNGSGLSRNMAVSFTIAGKGYVATGQGGNPYLYDVWQYDPATNAWTQKANFAGTARRGAAAFAIGNIGYVGTGQDGTGFTKDFWAFDSDSNQWSNIATFPGDGRRLAVGFAIGNKGYVGTGEGDTYYKDFWEYNPSLDQWTQKADFTGTPRTGAVGFSANGFGYVGTGYDNTLNNKNDLWEYDPANDLWSAFADPFPGEARANAVGFNIGSFLYIGTGFGNAPLRDMWQYGWPLGVQDVNAKEQVKIFPNPMISSSRITLNQPVQKGEFRLFDTNGKLVRILSDLSGSEFTFSKNELNAGNYFFEIFSGKNLISTGKLTVI